MFCGCNGYTDKQLSLLGRISELRFIDLYLGRSNVVASQMEGAEFDPSPLPDDCKEDASVLFSQCEKIMQTHPTGEFQIIYDGVTYRASILPSKHEPTFVLRRAEDSIRDVENIGLHPQILRYLMAPGLKGMIVICGPFGCGKTTTAAAVIKGRLEKYGKIAVTIEDPVELPLGGKHGSGMCYQTEVTPDRDFALGCKQSARWAPSIIFLGELRDRDASIEALRAAINGRIVIVTMHSSGVVSAIERLHSMAGGGQSPEVASIISSGLSLVLHQELVGRPAVLKTEFLFLSGSNDGDGARQLIKEQKFKHLSTEIQAQAMRISAAGRRVTDALTSSPT